MVGCANVSKRNPLPLELLDQAEIPGVPNGRFWGDEWPNFSIKIFETFAKEDLKKNFAGVFGKEHNYLAISGGGAEGAFGAGLLNGWSAAGTRPEFTMVTGISTGALTAPFAFLGSSYDSTLKDLYTTTETSDILIKRSPFSILPSDSVTDSSPLRRLIESHVDDSFVQAVADEHRRGRRLLIGTFNLDAARPVIWNIGAIAVSRYHKKKELIHDILLASASIPVAFPPVMIEVEVDGVVYDEMHVDGGTGAQVFVYPASFGWQTIIGKLEVPQAPTVYVLRNAFLSSPYSGVEQKILPIAGRSISSLIRTQGIGDLFRIFALCRRDGNDFNLAHIPSDFVEEPAEPFDEKYMGKLYELGYEMALKGYPWEKMPPGLSKRK